MGAGGGVREGGQLLLTQKKILKSNIYFGLVSDTSMTTRIRSVEVWLLVQDMAQSPPLDCMLLHHTE